MYRLIEWDSNLYYWLIIEKNNKIEYVLKDIEKKNPEYISKVLGTNYSFKPKYFKEEKLIKESKSIQELIEYGTLHIL